MINTYQDFPFPLLSWLFQKYLPILPLLRFKSPFKYAAPYNAKQRPLVKFQQTSICTLSASMLRLLSSSTSLPSQLHQIHAEVFFIHPHWFNETFSNEDEEILRSMINDF